MVTQRLSRWYEWLSRRRNLAVLIALGSAIAFVWNRCSSDSAAAPTSITQTTTQAQGQSNAQAQSTAVTINVPPPQTVTTAVPAVESATPPDVLTTKIEGPVDLSGTYYLAAGARLALSETEAVTVVALFGAEGRYTAQLAATFWPERPVHVEVGQAPFDTRIGDQLYRVSIPAIDPDAVTLKLARR